MLRFVFEIACRSRAGNFELKMRRIILTTVSGYSKVAPYPDTVVNNMVIYSEHSSFSKNKCAELY